MTELKILDLSHNSIGPEGAATLAGGLQYLTELRECNLSHNSVDVAAAKAVLTSLKKCDHLHRLVISSEYDHYFSAFAQLNSISESSHSFHVVGLVSSDDTATLSDLTEACQHKNITRTLQLVFKTVKVPPVEVYETVKPKSKSRVCVIL